jgi:hypothetical protein
LTGDDRFHRLLVELAEAHLSERSRPK